MPETIIVALIANGAALVGVVIQQRRQGRDVSAIKEQTNNSHTTNLRDDVDSAVRGIARVERYVADVAQDVRALHHSHDRAQERHDSALSDAIADRKHEIRRLRDDLPRIIDQHVHDCPLRNHTKPEE